jgi:hypothetical protein
MRAWGPKARPSQKADRRAKIKRKYCISYISILSRHKLRNVGQMVTTNLTPTHRISFAERRSSLTQTRVLVVRSWGIGGSRRGPWALHVGVSLPAKWRPLLVLAGDVGTVPRRINSRPGVRCLLCSCFNLPHATTASAPPRPQERVTP